MLLTENRWRTEPYTHGSGYRHLGVSVAGLDEAHARMTAAGLGPTAIDAYERDGQLWSRIFFVRDPHGSLYELIQGIGRFA